MMVVAIAHTGLALEMAIKTEKLSNIMSSNGIEKTRLS
jgi:hypothetical protein